MLENKIIHDKFWFIIKWISRNLKILLINWIPMSFMLITNNILNKKALSECQNEQV